MVRKWVVGFFTAFDASRMFFNLADIAPKQYSTELFAKCNTGRN